MKPGTSEPASIRWFDTTLRDGEMALSRKLTAEQKVQFALHLEAMGIDVLEVGYPGAFPKDAVEIRRVAEAVTMPTICALSGSNPDEITQAAIALKSAQRSRINLFTPIRLSQRDRLSEAQTLEQIQTSVTLARNHCEEVQWSAFDATRCDPEWLCRTVETAIRSGATTICIPDSLGVSTPADFTQLLDTVRNQVPNLADVAIAVHCHDDQGLAVQNSLAALSCGVRQIECSVKGLGARAGNANLRRIVDALQDTSLNATRIDLTVLPQAEHLVMTWKETQEHQ